MSSLNLTPNPIVMAIQTGFFLVNFYVIRKFFLQPYLRVADKRQTLTTGNQEEAQILAQKNQEAMATVSEKLGAAREEATKIRAQLTEEADRKKDAILSRADQEAKQIIESVQQEIQKELTEEEAKIPAIVADLTEDVYQKTVYV
jgi:F0F1-type ATP synthase membrane subunit b/b'